MSGISLWRTCRAGWARHSITGCRTRRCVHYGSGHHDNSATKNVDIPWHRGTLATDRNSPIPLPSPLQRETRFRPSLPCSFLPIFLRNYERIRRGSATAGGQRLTCAPKSATGSLAASLRLSFSASPMLPVCRHVCTFESHQLPGRETQRGNGRFRSEGWSHQQRRVSTGRISPSHKIS